MQHKFQQNWCPFYFDLGEKASRVGDKGALPQQFSVTDVGLLYSMLFMLQTRELIICPFSWPHTESLPQFSVHLIVEQLATKSSGRGKQQHIISSIFLKLTQILTSSISPAQSLHNSLHSDDNFEWHWCDNGADFRPISIQLMTSYLQQQ